MPAGVLHGQAVKRIGRPGRELRHPGHVVLSGVNPAITDPRVPGGHLRHAPAVPPAGRPAGRGLRGAGHHAHLPSRGHAADSSAGPAVVTAAEAAADAVQADAISTDCPGDRLVISGGRLGGSGVGLVAEAVVAVGDGGAGGGEYSVMEDVLNL